MIDQSSEIEWPRKDGIHSITYSVLALFESVAGAPSDDSAPVALALALALAVNYSHNGELLGAVGSCGIVRVIDIENRRVVIDYACRFGQGSKRMGCDRSQDGTAGVAYELEYAVAS